MTPTERTLKALRKADVAVDVVERWIPRANIRKDLFGVFDLVALEPGGSGVVGVQVTTYKNVSSRVKKIRASEHIDRWFECGNRVEVWGWRKVKRNGREVYRPRVLDLLPDGTEVDISAPWDPR